MKKNVAGQNIGCQMVSATDGSAFTGAVTVYVTGDAGTQAAGSVGAGACTHEGNGYHTYAPAQAETNYDLIAFTFIGTGAVPATVQVYPSFPQTGDSYAEVTSGTYGLSAIKGYVDGVESSLAAGVTVTTNNDKTGYSLANGAITAAVIATGAIDADAIAATAVTEIQAGLSTLDAAGVRTAVGLASANLDTQLDALPTAIENADALLNRDMSTGTDSGSPTVRTVRQALRFLRNKWAIAAGTMTVYKEDDTTASWTSALTTDAAAEPVTTSDPAS
jgi:hypothetical protein